MQPRPLSSGQAKFGAQVHGRVAVIDFWATWCEPCRDSIPKVVRLAQAYGGTELAVVGVHVGQGVERAQTYAREAGITYPLFADPDFAFSDRLAASSVPTVLVVDRDGTILHRGAELTPEVLALIRRALARPSTR